MSDLVLSLFPGLGLLDMAFEQEGFIVVRGPDVLWGGDIRRFYPPSGKFDGIIGGPPCQMFSSLARLVEANGHKTRFGNLIPEFERCIREAAPDWFLMENVPQAPEPVVKGYGATAIVLDNSALAGPDGFGQEQRRVRRFCFGTRGRTAPNLARWIDLAVFLLPDPERAVSSGTNFPHDEAFKTRQVAVTSTDGGERPSERKTRRNAVNSHGEETPMKLGGSGKPKPSFRHETLTGGHDRPRARSQAVTSNVGGEPAPSPFRQGPNGRGRYKLADACRLQGLPEDFLADSPFTAAGKLKAMANGVPLPLGRAIAGAIRQYFEEREHARES